MCSGLHPRCSQAGKADPTTVAALRAGLDERRFVSAEVTNTRKDGRSFQNLLSIVPVLDSSNSLLHFFGVLCDLDDKRKRAGAAAVPAAAAAGDPAAAAAGAADEAFQAKWQEQVRHYVQAFAVVDISSQSTPISSTSAAFTELTGYGQQDVLGWNMLCLCGPDSGEREMRKLITSQWAQKPCGVKLLCYKADGTPFWAFVYSCPVTPSRKQPAKYALCLIVDITTSRLKRVGKYVLGRVIGTGAFGLVRIGRNQQTGVCVRLSYPATGEGGEGGAMCVVVDGVCCACMCKQGAETWGWGWGVEGGREAGGTCRWC